MYHTNDTVIVYFSWLCLFSIQFRFDSTFSLHSSAKCLFKLSLKLFLKGRIKFKGRLKNIMTFKRKLKIFQKKTTKKFVCFSPLKSIGAEVVIYLIVIGHPIIILEGKNKAFNTNDFGDHSFCEMCLVFFPFTTN